jgi:hypothetical protein
MANILKMQMIKENAIATISKYFDQYVDEINQAYKNGDREVKIGFGVTVKMEKGQVKQRTEINFIKTRVKDGLTVKYDPDQILFDFEG